MRAPEFWTHDGPTARALLPLAWAYDMAGQVRRLMARPVRAGVPVICVGNLTAGGSGKTPAAMAVAGLLSRLGRIPHFLSRGYGGRLEGPLRVEPGRHTATDVGDEALLLAMRGPAWIGRDRPAGAAAAVAAGATAIVMDDGFQNPSLEKDFSLLVCDDGYGLGNGFVHPAGPLREDPGRGFARAQALLIVQSAAARSMPRPPRDLPTVLARLVPGMEAQALCGRRVVAFAGIGRPQRFFDTLRDLGAIPVGQFGFPDHHPYSADQIMQLIETASANDAIAVTTAKDAVRLPADARRMVTTVHVELEFDAPEALTDLLRRALAANEA